MKDDSTRIGGEETRFRTTRWSVVLAAKSAADGVPYRESLEALIRVYWKPVYSFVRRRWGRSNEDAKDLTQGFFADLLGRPFLASVDPDRGRFRTFIRACLEGYLSKRHASEKAQKRGGGARASTLDHADIPDTESEPNAQFNRAWKEAVLKEAIDRLREDCEREGRASTFAVFESLHLKTDDQPSYSELAARLKIKVTDVTNYLSRARSKYRALVRRIVRDSVASEADFRDEMTQLFGAD